MSFIHYVLSYVVIIACFCFTCNYLCTVYLAFIFNFCVIDVRLPCLYYAPARREGAISVAFVRPSVRPFVAYIANNSRTQRHSVPLMRLAYQFQGQRTRSSGPLMLTDIVRHVFQMARPTNFKLGTQMVDDDPHQPQAP